jgi:hypothetical protein
LSGIAAAGIGFVDLVEPEAVKFCLDNGPWLINGSEIRIEAKKPPRKDSEGRRGGGMSVGETSVFARTQDLLFSVVFAHAGL